MRTRQIVTEQLLHSVLHSLILTQRKAKAKNKNKRRWINSVVLNSLDFEHEFRNILIVGDILILALIQR